MNFHWRDDIFPALAFISIPAVVALICWLTVDVFGIDVSVSHPHKQIIVTKENGYECIRQSGDRASTCRRIEYVQGQ